MAHHPSAWVCSSTGATSSGGSHVGDTSVLRRVPSQQRHPQLTPRPSPDARVAASTSSRRPWPTSPMIRSPVVRSNDQRHGLRSPEDHVCTCLLYTSDAADEEDSVDLGGRRIIKKKT